MNSLDGTHQERVEWFIKAHSHSLYGALDIMSWYAGKRDFTKLAEAIERENDGLHAALKNFRTSSNLNADYTSMVSCLPRIEQIVHNADIDPNSRQDLLDMLMNANRNLEKLKQVVQDPLHEDREIIYKIMYLAFSDAVHAHVIPGQTLMARGIIFGFDSNKKSEEQPRHLCNIYEMGLLFQNIYNNILDAMASGNISSYIEHKPESGYATISITNTGSCISPENVERILTRQKFTTRPNGHGDGMLIVHDVLDKYGGLMRLTSDIENPSVRSELDIPYDRHMVNLRS